MALFGQKRLSRSAVYLYDPTIQQSVLHDVPAGISQLTRALGRACSRAHPAGESCRPTALLAFGDGFTALIGQRMQSIEIACGIAPRLNIARGPWGYNRR